MYINMHVRGNLEPTATKDNNHHNIDVGHFDFLELQEDACGEKYHKMSVQSSS